MKASHIQSWRHAYSTYCILQNLPASHPALLWTCGSTRGLHQGTSQHYLQNLPSLGVLHNTLPGFRQRNTGSRPCRNGWETPSSDFHMMMKTGAVHDVKKPLRICDPRLEDVAPSLSPNQKCNIHKHGEGGTKKQFVLSPEGIVDASPLSIQPYLKLVRLDKPIGTWLTFLPSAWSLSLAAPAGQFPDPYTLALFAMGAILMRGAGCTINDMWDKDFDSKVVRTRDRPLACGQISRFQALTFLGVQLSAALAILLQFNNYTILLGSSAVALCVMYPLMKRVTYWPQAFLGSTFNWGVLLGWTATTGALDWQVLPLYLSAFAWTMVYDTIYAHQDKDDDIIAGVKSTALKFGEQSKYYLCGFASLMTGGLALTGCLCDQTWPYFLGVSMVGSHLAYQIYSVDLNNAEHCGKTFRSNRNLGLWLWMLIMAGNIVKGRRGASSLEEEEDATIEQQNN